MGFVKLHLLDEQYKNTELKVSYINKKLTLNNGAVNERRAIPVNFVDPDGREVRGITKQDAQTFRDDIYKVLADDKFANVRTLIDIKGKTFKSIDAGKLSSAWICNSGDGLNIPTQNGSHSFIGGSSLQGSERAVISGHEVFGHGIPAAKKLTPVENNANAIRTDNLIRRILGLPQIDGSNHGGYKEGYITNPYILPILTILK